MSTLPLDDEPLRAIVDDAGLDGSALRPLPALDLGEQVWTVPLHPSRWFDGWKAMREAVPRTGRWPVAVTFWGEEVEVLRRDGRTAEPDRWPRAMMDRLAGVDVNGLLDRLERAPEPVDALFEWGEQAWYGPQRDATERRCGRVPERAEVVAALGESCTETALERWLLTWETEHCADQDAGDAGYLDWFEPEGMPVDLVLLPRAEPWAAACYLDSWEAGWPHPDLRPALFRRWHERYGAEPVANWGTMQQLVVPRPPTDLDAAWELARAQALVWADTVALPGVTVRELARDLVGRHRWFLHLRP